MTPLPHLTDRKAFERIDLVFILLLVVLTIVTRVPFQSKLLFEGDSVNFALGMDDYDVSAYRPHPPGYILFIGTADLFHLIMHDENSSLIATAIFFSALTVVFLYLLGKEMFSREVGLVSSLLLLSVPLFWLHGEVALSYSAGSCFAALIGFCSYRIFLRDNKSRWIYITALVLGLSGGIRQDILLFMFPMVVYSVFMNWQGWKTVLRAGMVLGVSFALWYVPMVLLSHGYAAYSRTLSDQFDYYVTYYSILFGNSPLKHFIMVKDFLLVFFGASYIALIYIVASFFVYIDELTTYLRDPRVILLLLWLLPSVLFLMIVFFQQPGYVLTPLPAVYLVFGGAMVALTRRYIRHRSVRFALVLQLGIVTLIHSYNFLGTPPSGIASAAATPFAEKTWGEVANTLVYKAFFRSTEKSVRGRSTASEIYTTAIRDLSFRPDEVAILIFHRSSWDFSLAMYYLPEYSVYYVQDYRPLPDKIRYGKSHRMEESVEGSVIRLPATTRCIVTICSEDGPSYELLAKEMHLNKVQLPHRYSMFVTYADSIAFKYKNLLFTNRETKQGKS